jgi:uncharacterized protein (TIGR03663 family)
VRRIAPRLRRLRRPEALAWIALVVAALVVRLIDLGERPFHHDESQDAYFSFLFSESGDYEYNPLLHGPLRFYLTAVMYWLFGDSDFTARLAPALMGTLMVPLPIGLRHQIGRAAAFAAGLMVAFGPSYLYFSRFAREDIYIACITLAMIVVAFRFLERPRVNQPALFGALLALSFATKETTFITVFVGGSFFLAVLAFRRELVLRPLRAVGWEAWAYGLAAFVAVFTILFTTFLTHPGGLWDGIYTGLEYWLGQHPEGRGGEAWFFYGVILAGVEWPVLALGLVAAIATVRRPTLLRAFLIWSFAVSLAVYSWAGEKFAWLVLHPLLPLLLLAAIGVQVLWDGRRRRAGRVGIALAAVALAYSGLSSYWVNAVHRAHPRELLVSTQSAEDVKRVADQVLAAQERTPRRLMITIDASEGASFPWAWYFRHLDAQFPELGASGELPQSDIAILTDAARARLRASLGTFRESRFRFRVWWVRDYDTLTPGTAWAWLSRREPWNRTGGMYEWLEWSRRLPTG